MRRTLALLACGFDAIALGQTLVMSTILKEAYQARHWSLSGLQGISDHTLEVHFGLYEGYVKNTNLLNEELASLSGANKNGQVDPRFAELERHMGFEYNGMRLHELYFDNLTASGKGEPGPGVLKDTLTRQYGDYETWKREFFAVGGMRGVGWAIAYQDPASGRLSNHWITLHEDGNIAGFTPIVVMDVWEHAYMFDYKPADRGKYIEAFFANLNWEMCESRLKG